MPKQSKLNITFKIEHIEVLEFFLNQPSNVKEFSKESFHFDINAKVFFDVPKGFLGIDSIIDIYQPDPKKTHLCHLLTRFLFEIKKFSEIFNEKDGNITFPDEVIPQFISIAASTSRGILFTKTSGTFLNNVYLPIVNPMNFKGQKPKDKVPKT